MFTFVRKTLAALAVLLTLTAVAAGPALAQEYPAPQPIELPCATNAFSQLLAATPVGDGSQTLVQARVIFGPGGMIDAHTHPGTLIATVESGVLGFTHLGDGEMTVQRAATAESSARSVPLPHGEEVAINAGDHFVETGMVHTGVNLAEGDTTVLLTGLIETGQPLTICAGASATPAQHARD